MLIKFSLENWRSFRDQTEFSMIATREREHGEHVARVGKYRLRLLPIAVLYGGNASGKSNFVAAMRFVKQLVVPSSQPEGSVLPSPFALSPDGNSSPTKFIFELLINETVYKFSFAVDSEKIVEEQLTRMTSSSAKVLYKRKDGKFKFPNATGAQRGLWRLVERSMVPNQLFLTKGVENSIGEFLPVVTWFTRLTIVEPNSRYPDINHFVDKTHAGYEWFTKTLSQLDTGIERLEVYEVPPEAAHYLLEQEEFRRAVMSLPPFKKIKNVQGVLLTELMTGGRFVLSRKADGGISVKRIRALHRRSDGKETGFDLSMESSGTRRMIELLPAFMSLSPQDSDAFAPKVHVIDEVDNSLHPHMIQKVVGEYLDGCSNESRTQLIMTTHDVTLMNHDSLRHDELWGIERDEDGASSMFSFSDYNLRNHEDISKLYLQSRLGGVPKIV